MSLISRLILLAFLGMLITEFARGGEITIPYRWFSPPTATVAHVQVQWVDAKTAAAICKGGAACWFESATGNNSLIVAQQPKDFNDERSLMILGHEFFHALGAQHD